MGGSSCKKTLTHLPPVVHQMMNRERGHPWEVVHTCSLSNWSKYEAAEWGFDPFINYTSRADMRLQPWTTRGRYFTVMIPAPETQDLDMSPHRMYATMCIEEKKNKYSVQTINLPISYFKDRLKFAEVIAYEYDYAVVECATYQGRMDILLVDMRCDSCQFVYSLQAQDRPYMYECAISPDRTGFILKPNEHYARMHEIMPDDKIISIKTEGNGKSVRCSTILEKDALGVAFDFDPRYRNSRLLMANIMRNKTNMLTLFDLNKNMAIRERPLNVTATCFVQKLSFSPAGSHVAVLLNLNMCPPPPFFFSDVQLYDVDSLSLVHIIGNPNIYVNCQVSMTPGAIFPQFSANGSFLAVGLSRPVVLNEVSFNRVAAVAVHKVPPSVNLQNICRSKILLLVDNSEIRHLPLPSALKRFLLFEPQGM